jgi:hypothetical protein
VALAPPNPPPPEPAAAPPAPPDVPVVVVVVVVVPGSLTDVLSSMPATTRHPTRSALEAKMHRKNGDARIVIQGG